MVDSSIIMSLNFGLDYSFTIEVTITSVQITRFAVHIILFPIILYIIADEFSSPFSQSETCRGSSRGFFV